MISRYDKFDRKMIHLASISRNEGLGLFSSMIISEMKRDYVVALDVWNKWEILLDFFFWIYTKW